MIIKQNEKNELYCTICKRICDSSCWEGKCKNYYDQCKTCKHYFDDTVCDTCSFTDTKWEDKYHD